MEIKNELKNIKLIRYKIKSLEEKLNNKIENHDCRIDDILEEINDTKKSKENIISNLEKNTLGFINNLIGEKSGFVFKRKNKVLFYEQYSLDEYSQIFDVISHRELTKNEQYKIACYLGTSDIKKDCINNREVFFRKREE